MVRLRFKRMGRTNVNFFRLCAFDGRTRRDGRAIEELGWYDPKVADEAKKYSLHKERIQYWLSVGAQPSETVSSVLVKNGIPIPPSKTKLKKKAHAKARGSKSGGEKKQKAK
jgi:small subunit ribosomal protein S16